MRSISAAKLQQVAGPEIVSPDGSVRIRDNAMIDAGVCPQPAGRLFMDAPQPGSITYSGALR